MLFSDEDVKTRQINDVIDFMIYFVFSSGGVNYKLLRLIIR